MSRRLLLCATLLLAGCTAAPPASPVPTSPAPDPRLVAFDSCARLAADLRAAAAPLIGPYGLPGSDYGISDITSGGARTALAAPAPGPAFSGTNVQEPGVDEPDVVKTDGRRIVRIDQDGVLRVVDAASRVQTGKLDLGVPATGELQLLLAGDRALVLVPPGGGSYRSTPVPLGGGTSRMALVGEPGRPEVILVGLAGAPTVLSRYTGEGTIVDARQTGSIGRVVLKTGPRIQFPLLPAVRDNNQRTAANRAVLEAAPADEWLPNWQVTTGTSTTKGHVGCERVSRPAAYSGTSMVTLLTFDLGAATLTDGDPVSVLADGDTVYGTPTSIYVTNDQRWQGMLPHRDVPNRTQIFRFDIRAGRPSFAAEGAVPGLPINQYALSEWDGHLRIATTEVKDGGSSAVRVLQQQGNRLVQTGVVDGLGHGERIYAVRFAGPRGYVVTFRQTDPLYSVDLGDPAHPRVVGELKLPGFSTYLQPVGDDRLAGIGEQPGDRGAQVTLFDVSNPAAPRQLAQQRVAGVDANDNPHAVLWWPATKLLVVPMNVGDPRQGGQQNAGLALRVTDTGLERIAMIQQPVNNHPRAGQERFPFIKRTLVIGDLLWTVSDEGLQASNLSTLDRVSWLPN